LTAPPHPRTLTPVTFPLPLTSRPWPLVVFGVACRVPGVKRVYGGSRGDGRPDDCLPRVCLHRGLQVSGVEGRVTLWSRGERVVSCSPSGSSPLTVHGTLATPTSLVGIPDACCSWCVPECRDLAASYCLGFVDPYPTPRSGSWYQQLRHILGEGVDSDAHKSRPFALDQSVLSSPNLVPLVCLHNATAAHAAKRPGLAQVCELGVVSQGCALASVIHQSSRSSSSFSSSTFS
jgi:hypothetical protein